MDVVMLSRETHEPNVWKAMVRETHDGKYEICEINGGVFVVRVQQ